MSLKRIAAWPRHKQHHWALHRITFPTTTITTTSTTTSSTSITRMQSIQNSISISTGTNTNMDSDNGASTSSSSRNNTASNRVITMKWTNKTVLQLIDEVQLNDSIWNVNSDVYRDRCNKARGWEKIGERCGVSADQCRIKWNSLRTSFHVT